MRFCNYLLLLHIATFFTMTSSFNYIVNGGFEDPVISPGSIPTNNVTGWNGLFKLMNIQTMPGYNQQINLQYAWGQNGYIQQTISLPS